MGVGGRWVADRPGAESQSVSKEMALMEKKKQKGLGGWGEVAICCPFVMDIKIILAHTFECSQNARSSSVFICISSFNSCTTAGSRGDVNSCFPEREIKA